jgi:hypothetical protein
MGADTSMALALGVLPPLPCAVVALGEQSARIDLRLAGSNADRLQAEVDARQCGKDDVLVIPIQQGRGGFAVSCRVTELYFLGGDKALAELEVTEVARRKPHRSHERIPVDTAVDITVLVAESLPEGKRFVARLLDMSSHGAAFVTDQDLIAGDLIEVRGVVVGERLTARARVANVSWQAFGRRRVGCRFNEAVGLLDRAAPTAASGPPTLREAA